MVEISKKRRFVFNPDEETKEMLIATFAIRKDIFEKVFKIIKSSSRDTAPQHFLLVGQRGMGKTTLLLRLKYEMEDDLELKNYLLPIRFSEEQYQVGCLPDLWEETALYLESLNPAFTGLKEEMLKHEKEKDYERIAFDILTKKIKETKKRAVLLIDNIGDLFSKLTEQETHRFREILMTSPCFQLIGASAHMLEHTFRYDKPFFEFFYQLKLGPLKKQEARDMMMALAVNYDAYNKIEKIIKEKPERIEVLRRITGGVPRTLVLLFEILSDSNNGTAFEDLESLIDKVTDVYKTRMDNLKPQQQKIMDALARAWEPITANEILEQSKLYRENLASNQVSAQLKQLEENQLVESIELGKRKKAYRIRERFFNIWYLMRHGRKNTKEQVLWLIRFLESWCSIDELKEMAAKQIDSLQKGNYSAKAAFYKAVALHAIKDIEPETKKELLRYTESHLEKTKNNDWAKTIHSLAEEIKPNSYFEKAYKAEKEGNLQLAEKILFEAIGKNEPEADFYLALFYDDKLKDIDKAEQFYLKAIEKGDVKALNNLAILYKNERKDLDKAEQFYLKAIEKGDVYALFNLALLYQSERKDFDKAEQFYLKAIEKGDVKALNNLALLYESERKDFDKAEQFYLKAIKKGDVDALFNLALLYENERKDFDKAEQFYLKAIDKGDVKALNNLALLYKNEKKDFDKAEQFYLKAIEKGHVDALFNLALLYESERKDFDKAEQFYLKAIDKGHVGALFNLALLYESERKDFDKAEQFYLKAIKKGDVDALFNLALLYQIERKDIDKAEQFYLKAIEKGDVDALNNLASLYESERKDFDKAEQFYLKAIEKGDVDALNNLANLYAEKNDLDKAEQFYLKAIEKGDIKVNHNYIYLLLKQKRINESLNQAAVLFEKESYFAEHSGHAIQLVLEFIKYGQYHFLLKRFQQENSLLMKVLQPVYYVLAWFMKDELPGEYEKAGAEIKETVEEMIKTVEDEKAGLNK